MTTRGLLTGLGFALLYTVLVLPIARPAETRNRVGTITVCVALWSPITAACGVSREIVIGSLAIGAVWVLLACRVGVGIGEAGCTPPANSLIAMGGRHCVLQPHRRPDHRPSLLAHGLLRRWPARPGGGDGAAVGREGAAARLHRSAGRRKARTHDAFVCDPGTSAQAVPYKGILASLERPLTSAQFEFCNFVNASSTEAAVLSIATLHALAGVFS